MKFFLYCTLASAAVFVAALPAKSTTLLDGLRAYAASDFVQAEQQLLAFSRVTQGANGHPQADMYLGRIYAYGLLNGQRRDETNADDHRAIEHLRVAAEAGIIDAQRLLGDELLDLAAPDTVAAAHWYARAAKAGDAGATYRLAELFEYGLGLERNRDQAERYYRRAFELGEPLGQMGLDRLARRVVAEEIRDRASRLAESKPVFVARVESLSVALPDRTAPPALSAGETTGVSGDVSGGPSADITIATIQPVEKPTVVALAPPQPSADHQLATICTSLDTLTQGDRKKLRRARLFGIKDQPEARPDVWAALNNSLACRLDSGQFGPLVAGGYVSLDATNMKVRRSIRTNNPGALNISTRRWERVIPGFAGVHKDDGRGNKTVIYHSPEHGVMALFLLLTEIYSFGDTGSIDVAQLATWYSGRGRAWGLKYLKAWDRFSPRDLRAERYLSIDDSDAMVDLMTAIAAFEIGKPSPLTRGQFAVGLQMARELQRIASATPEALALLTADAEGNRRAR